MWEVKWVHGSTKGAESNFINTHVGDLTITF